MDVKKHFLGANHGRRSPPMNVQPVVQRAAISRKANLPWHINLVIGDPTKTTRDLVSQAQGSDLQQAKSVYRKIVIPLAMPLLVGSGAIANVILHASQAEAIKQDGLLIEFAIGIIFVSFLTFVIFLSAK